MRNGPSLRPIKGVFFLKKTPFWKMLVLNPIPFCLLFCLSEETEDKIPQWNNIIPTLGAQGKSRKRRWKGCRRQRTRIPLVGQCLLDMTGKLHAWNLSIRIVQARFIVTTPVSIPMWRRKISKGSALNKELQKINDSWERENQVIFPEMKTLMNYPVPSIQP